MSCRLSDILDGTSLHDSTEVQPLLGRVLTNAIGDVIKAIWTNFGNPETQLRRHQAKIECCYEGFGTGKGTINIDVSDSSDNDSSFDDNI